MVLPARSAPPVLPVMAARGAQPLCGLRGCPDAMEDIHDLRDFALTE